MKTTVTVAEALGRIARLDPALSAFTEVWPEAPEGDGVRGSAPEGGGTPDGAPPGRGARAADTRTGGNRTVDNRAVSTPAAPGRSPGCRSR